MTVQLQHRTPRRDPAEGTERVETVIIGAGQAGLSLGYHLARRGRPCVILEGNARVGDVWRQRFDSLRLYTPARYNALPGMPFPGEPWAYPTKDEMADYLEAYAERFELPVRTGVRVDELHRDGDRYVARARDRTFVADHAVVATGTWQTPVTPPFAAQLDPGIRQLHSDAYRNPGQLQPGPVLVVGASHSGSDIAYDVACASFPTVLAGRIHGQVPFRLEGRAARVGLRVMWFVANRVLTVRNPIGAKVRGKVRSGGGPLVRVKRADLAAAGVEHVPARVAGVTDGMPVLEDGRVLDVANVIWCTGFAKDDGWIRMPVTGADGWLDQKRGAVRGAPGLYVVGLPFLQRFASMLVGGVGRDAEHVARSIARSARA